MLKLIVGLGNPGKKYQKSRHNIGYQVLDALKNHQDQLGKIELFKPGVFMNISGQAVVKKARAMGIRPQDILVILDDLDLELGKIRVRLSGSSAGHLGMTSVIKEVGNQDIPRLRIGIDRPPQGINPNNFVIQKFSQEEQREIKRSIDKAVEIILEFVSNKEIKELSWDNKKPS